MGQLRGLGYAAMGPLRVLKSAISVPAMARSVAAARRAVCTSSMARYVTTVNPARAVISVRPAVASVRLRYVGTALSMPVVQKSAMTATSWVEWMLFDVPEGAGDGVLHQSQEWMPPSHRERQGFVEDQELCGLKLSSHKTSTTSGTSDT